MGYLLSEATLGFWFKGKLSQDENGAVHLVGAFVVSTFAKIQGAVLFAFSSFWILSSLSASFRFLANQPGFLTDRPLSILILLMPLPGLAMVFLIPIFFGLDKSDIKAINGAITTALNRHD
jgi:hypothetical protein